MRRRISLVMAACVCAAIFSPAARAQKDWPTKPIKFVVPYAPGGTSDSVSRYIARWLEQKLGQPIIVENRSGAGTMIGTGEVAKAAPDGYTFLTTATPLAINETLQPKRPYSLWKDLTPVSGLWAVPVAFIVNPASPAKTLADFVTMAKAKPGALSFGTSGMGAAGHLAMEMFQHVAGVQLIHVPFRGSAPSVNALVAGQVDITAETVSLSTPQIEQGRARALAQTGAVRSRLQPNVPTVAESGFAGFEMTSWGIMMAPAGVPKDIIARMNSAVGEVLAMPETQEFFNKQGLQALSGQPGDAARFLHREVEKLGAVVKSAGMKPE